MNARALLLAVFVSLASCVTSVPKAITEGVVEIPVMAYERVAEVDPLTGIPNQGSYLQAMDDVVCTLRNDKGAWTVETSARLAAPRIVAVERSAQPLQVECSKAGYRPIGISLQCRSPRELELESHQGATGAVLTALLPIGLLTGPGLIWAVSGVHAASAGPHYDLCNYWGVFSPMVRANDPSPVLYGWHRLR